MELGMAGAPGVGQRDWRQGSTAREAIRQAVLLA
jgi:hypothetical protein